jgi:hypothetical protein
MACQFGVMRLGSVRDYVEELRRRCSQQPYGLRNLRSACASQLPLMPFLPAGRLDHSGHAHPIPQGYVRYNRLTSPLTLDQFPLNQGMERDRTADILSLLIHGNAFLWAHLRRVIMNA